MADLITYTIPNIANTRVLPKTGDYREIGSTSDSAKELASNTAYKVNSLAELKALSVASVPNGLVVILAGSTSLSDGLGGVYSYSSGSSATNNDFSVVQPTTGSGRWLRVAFVETLQLALSDEVTALTTGQVATMRAAWGMTLVDKARININTASSSGAVTVDIKKNGTTLFSVKPNIDASEKSSTTAAAQAAYSVTTVADDDELTFFIDGAGTGAKGLKCIIYFYRT